MANKAVKFLGYTIDGGSVDDIERAAIAKVQERAHRLYVDQGGHNYSVAQAWVEAVLEFLYNEGVRNAGGSNEQE